MTPSAAGARIGAAAAPITAPATARPMFFVFELDPFLSRPVHHGNGSVLTGMNRGSLTPASRTQGDSGACISEPPRR
jgi:hypothetical protein